MSILFGIVISLLLDAHSFFFCFLELMVKNTYKLLFFHELYILIINYPLFIYLPELLLFYIRTHFNAKLICVVNKVQILDQLNIEVCFNTKR